MSGRLTRLTAATGALTLALLLGGCGTTRADDPTSGAESGSRKKCGSFTIAVSPWVGYEADAAVIEYVAEKELGCKVKKKRLTEEEGWRGLDSGKVDVVLENWGHEDLRKKYVDQRKTVVAAGENGNTGIIGWYVPPWMAEKYSDIVDWRKLNTYADIFKTVKSGNKGQLLDGDPSFVTNDAALVKNLRLNYKVVYAGSEEALIRAFRRAQAKKTPLIGYFYEPQWLFSELELVKVQLPEHTPGCDNDLKKVACDYPDYRLDKYVSRRFAESGSPAYELVRNFKWANDDQNLVAKYITEDKMSPEKAAEKWINDTRIMVDSWLA